MTDSNDILKAMLDAVPEEPEELESVILVLIFGLAAFGLGVGIWILLK